MAVSQEWITFRYNTHQESVYNFANPITKEIPNTFPKVGTYQYVQASFTPFPVHCLLIASGSFTICSNQFNLAVQLYFKDNTVFDNRVVLKEKLKLTNL